MCEHIHTPARQLYDPLGDLHSRLHLSIFLQIIRCSEYSLHSEAFTIPFFMFGVGSRCFSTSSRHSRFSVLHVPPFTKLHHWITLSVGSSQHVFGKYTAASYWTIITNTIQDVLDSLLLFAVPRRASSSILPRRSCRMFWGREACLGGRPPCCVVSMCLDELLGCGGTRRKSHFGMCLEW